MTRALLCLLVMLAGCSTNRWMAAHEACQGDATCQDLVEAKHAAVTPAPQATSAGHDQMVLPVVPLPRQPNTCAGRNEDNFPTTRCY